jgi:hypothetical protein
VIVGYFLFSVQKSLKGYNFVTFSGKSLPSGNLIRGGEEIRKLKGKSAI